MARPATINPRSFKTWRCSTKKLVIISTRTYNPVIWSWTPSAKQSPPVVEPVAVPYAPFVEPVVAPPSCADYPAPSSTELVVAPSSLAVYLALAAAMQLHPAEHVLPLKAAREAFHSLAAASQWTKARAY